MNYDILLAAKNAIEPVCTTTLLVLTTWFITRTVIKKNEGKRDIILAALEKNPNLDTGELIKCFQTGFSTFKERLLKKLLWGSIFTFAGLLGLAMLLIAAIVGGEANKDVYFTYSSTSWLYPIVGTFATNNTNSRDIVFTIFRQFIEILS